MSPILRAWLCLAWAAAGLIHLALALGSPTVVAAVLGCLGLGEFVLALLIVASGRLLAPRALLGSSLIPVVAWIAALLVRDPATSATLQFVPLATSTLLELFVATAIGIHLRRQRAGTPPGPAPSTRRFLLGVLAGVLVVAAITAPALAVTQGARTTSPGGTFTDEHLPH